VVPASGWTEPVAGVAGRRKSITNSAYLLSKNRDAAGVAVGKNFGAVLAFGVLASGAVWVDGRGEQGEYRRFGSTGGDDLSLYCKVGYACR
jgi:hypothetical protein